MLELQDFIVASLREIVDGVKKARIELTETGAKVAARVRTTGSNASSSILGHDDGGTEWNNIYAVDFDVAITVTQEAGSEAKIGVFAGMFGAAGGMNKKDSDAQYSRVKFTVPLVLPKD
jgi:hypothetical protein